MIDDDLMTKLLPYLRKRVTVLPHSAEEPQATPDDDRKEQLYARLLNDYINSPEGARSCPPTPTA